MVLRNLARAAFPGRIIPIHRSAAEIDGFAAVSAVEALPSGVDLAVVAVPAPSVLTVLRQLEAAGVRAALVFAAGFTASDEEALRQFTATSRMTIHGPNCMGLINLCDQVPLYPSTLTERLGRGRAAYIAHSGSAAIAVMNSTSMGFSRLVTMGSEFQVNASDYVRWLAGDPETAVIGVAIESVRNPDAFAQAAQMVHAAGKPLFVLKVGYSEMGGRAVQAHTGALITPRDAYRSFFERHRVATVVDYDELIASMECAVASRVRAPTRRVGIVGISGGETALTCDLAADLGVEIAEWGRETESKIRAALPSCSGHNPLDLGRTVEISLERDTEALEAILDDPAVDALLVVQDAQASLAPASVTNYLHRIQNYGDCARTASKPTVMISATSDPIHPRIAEAMARCGVPVLRGLRAGLVGLRNLGHQAEAILAMATGKLPPTGAEPNGRLADIKSEVKSQKGPLSAALSAMILEAYGINIARSALARSADEAVAKADEIGYPLVVKVSSADVLHRSDLGGVVLGVRDAAALRRAIEAITRNVRDAKPTARIDGFELQEELVDRIEAMVGSMPAPLFGALTVIGSGGTLVELQADRVVELGPFSPQEARTMIRRTRLGALLGGYRNLVPETDLDPLAELASRFSRLAADLSDCLSACDLNPVLIEKKTGRATVVDALLVAQA
jgi:acetyltransferase